MSVSQSTSSIFQVEQRRALHDAHRDGGHGLAQGDWVILPAAISVFTASCAATHAPVMAAVRVPPSAWITSQSSWMVRSPSNFRSNTAAGCGR